MGKGKMVPLGRLPMTIVQITDEMKYAQSYYPGKCTAQVGPENLDNVPDEIPEIMQPICKQRLEDIYLGFEKE